MCYGQWRSQGHCFWGGQIASGEGTLGDPPPNFYTDLDFSNGLEHNWGGGGAVAPLNYVTWGGAVAPLPPLTMPLGIGENSFVISILHLTKKATLAGKNCLPPPPPPHTHTLKLGNFDLCT